MSLPLWFAIIWVFAGVATAFLPMRRQYVPGVILLVLAPVIILWIGAVHGWVFAGLALMAFVSMFRNPLRYIWRKYVLRQPVELPK